MTEEVAAPATVAPAAPAAPTPAATPSAKPAEGGTPAQNTAETAPAATPGDGKTPATPDPAEKRSTNRFERKIDRLHRRAAEAEARASHFERQLNERQAAQQAADPNAPRLEQFKDIEEFTAAREKHAAEKALKDHTSKQQAELSKRAQQKLVEQWEARVEKAADKYEDFDAVVGELKPDSPWSISIMEAENGDDIAHYLGNHIEEATEIAQMTPRAQVRAIAKLEQKLLDAPPKVQKPSQAPAPIKPLTGTSHAEAFDVRNTNDTAKWIKERQKQVHGSRR